MAPSTFPGRFSNEEIPMKNAGNCKGAAIFAALVVVLGAGGNAAKADDWALGFSLISGGFAGEVVILDHHHGCRCHSCVPIVGCGYYGRPARLVRPVYPRPTYAKSIYGGRIYAKPPVRTVHAWAPAGGYRKGIVNAPTTHRRAPIAAPRHSGPRRR